MGLLYFPAASPGKEDQGADTEDNSRDDAHSRSLLRRRGRLRRRLQGRSYRGRLGNSSRLCVRRGIRGGQRRAGWEKQPEAAVVDHSRLRQAVLFLKSPERRHRPVAPEAVRRAGIEAFRCQRLLDVAHGPDDGLRALRQDEGKRQHRH